MLNKRFWTPADYLARLEAGQFNNQNLPNILRNYIQQDSLQNDQVAEFISLLANEPTNVFRVINAFSPDWKFRWFTYLERLTKQSPALFLLLYSSKRNVSSTTKYIWHLLYNWRLQLLVFPTPTQQWAVFSDFHNWTDFKLWSFFTVETNIQRILPRLHEGSRNRILFDCAMTYWGPQGLSRLKYLLRKYKSQNNIHIEVNCTKTASGLFTVQEVAGLLAQQNKILGSVANCQKIMATLNSLLTQPKR